MNDYFKRRLEESESKSIRVKDIKVKREVSRTERVLSLISGIALEAYEIYNWSPYIYYNYIKPSTPPTKSVSTSILPEVAHGTIILGGAAAIAHGLKKI